MSARGIVVPMVGLAAFAAGCTGGEREATQEPQAATTGRTTAPAPTGGGTTVKQGTTSAEETRTAGGTGTAGLEGSNMPNDGASGNVASEERDVGGFDEVELSGIGNLSVRQTGTESLTVRAEKDVLPKIRTEVVDGRLIIGPEPDTSIRTTEPIDYELTVDDLGALELSGSGNIDAEDIDTDSLGIEVRGSGAITASGRAESQRVNISGSGSYEALNLQSRRAKVDVEGAGSVVVNVSENLDARVSGAGSVQYAGAPTVDQDVSGAGRVSKH